MIFGWSHSRLYNEDSVECIYIVATTHKLRQ